MKLPNPNSDPFVTGVILFIAAILGLVLWFTPAPPEPVLIVDQPSVHVHMYGGAPASQASP